MTSTVALEARRISHSYGRLRALSDVSLAVAPASVHALIGPNGAGKSTLLHIIAGMIRPTDGSVHLKQRDVTRWPAWRRARLGLGIAFQVAHVLSGLTVRDSVEVAAACRRSEGVLSTLRRSRQAEHVAAEQSLRACGIVDLAEAQSDKLSQGDRKRVELAMVLAAGSDVILLDEPTSGMSAAETAQTIALIRRLAREEEVAVLLVEHDMQVVHEAADVVTVLSEGVEVFNGSVAAMVDDQKVRDAYLGATFGLASRA